MYFLCEYGTTQGRTQGIFTAGEGSNTHLLYGFAESWILIGRRAVRKMRIRTVVRIFPYPDRFPICQFDRLEFETFLHVYKVVM
jgi:hypothetical protein